MNREKHDLAKWRPKSRLVIILDDLDLSFYPWELKEIADMWGDGWSVKRMAKHYDKDPDEIVLALMHLARQRVIDRRPGGALGIPA